MPDPRGRPRRRRSPRGRAGLALIGGLATTGAALTAGLARTARPPIDLPGVAHPRPAGSATVERPAGAHAPRRIVSLVPAATELLFALGAGERLVGRTHWGVHPPAAREVPDLGDAIRPSLERIVARRPDLVILYRGTGTAGTVERLDRLGIPTLLLRHDTLRDLLRNVLLLGETVGCGGSARLLRRRIVRDLDAVAAATAGRDRPSVYYDVWQEPPITIGRGSYLDTLIHLAGGRNVFHDVGDASPQVSLEAIAARDPDLVLFPVSESEDGSRPAPSDRTGWRVVRAVAEGRVRRVDGDLVHRLGPRIAGAAHELAGAIHPGAIAPRGGADVANSGSRAGPCVA